MLRLVAIALLVLALPAADAVAQAPPNADFAGGAASGPGPIPDGTSEIGIRVDGSGARATVRAVAVRVVTRRRGRPYCSGDVPFDARPAPALAGDPAPVPGGAMLLGRTSGRAGGPFGFNLRVSADGRRVDRVVTTWLVTAGRFVAGGATGTLRARSTARSRKTGRTIDRCDTGALTWSAVVA